MAEVVLIVDDDPVQRRLLEAMIQRFGYRTTVVEGGDAACKAAGWSRGRTHRRRRPRSCHAGSRRAWRAGAHARSQRHRSRDRPDGAWRHRQHRLRDARRRNRFCRQAGERRAAAGIVAKCTRDQRAGRRTAAPQAQARGHVQHRRRDHTLIRNAARAQGGGKSRGVRDSGSGGRRIRRRQRADRARHSWQRRAPHQAIRCRQLRRPPRNACRVRSCSATRKVPLPAPPKSTAGNS